MRNQLDERLERVRSEGHTAFIPYLMAGDPSPDGTLELMQAILASGADVLEIGFPFSDPIADGPTIQAAGVRALATGIRTGAVLEIAAEIHRRSDTPLVGMAYANPIVQYGVAQFARDAARSGLNALIVPDLSFEERALVEDDLNQHGLHLIPLVAPTTPEPRLRSILEAASGGFIYAVSVTGVTGARIDIGPQALRLLTQMEEITGIPRALGFGIRDGAAAARYRGKADAVVVGSALVDAHGGRTDREAIAKLISLCQDIAQTLH